MTEQPSAIDGMRATELYSETTVRLALCVIKRSEDIGFPAAVKEAAAFFGISPAAVVYALDCVKSA